MTDFIIICHGKSEVILARWLQSRTRVRINVDSNNGGERSVMINNLNQFLDENGYKNSSSLKRRFPNIEYKNRIGLKDLRIFTLMDVDVDGKLVHDYLNRDMFRGRELYESITPILSDRSLDDVFDRIGLHVDRNSKAESYRKILNNTAVDDLYLLLKECESTNLDCMMEEILKHSPDFQGKI